MPRNPNWVDRTNRVYAKGLLRPRRKYERSHPYDQFPDFANQQGEVGGLEIRTNNIISVRFLGKFRGYSSWGAPVWYRAFAVRLQCGKVVAGYSNDGDQYVLCLHTGYVAA